MGVKNDVEEIFKIAKKVKCFYNADAAQSIARVPVDVKFGLRCISFFWT